MTDKAVSPLRRRMIEDMPIRKLAPKTQASYIRAVRDFMIFLGRSPDQASAEDLRRIKHPASSSISIPARTRGDGAAVLLRRDAWAQRRHGAHALRSRAQLPRRRRSTWGAAKGA
jgi:hypothetical protein